MKKIFGLVMIIFIGHFANAQKPDSLQTSTEKAKYDKGPYITLQAGQVILVNNGKADKLEKDKTLADGTTVSTSGVVKKTDGTTIQMKEGDRIYLDGGLSQSKKDNAPM